MSAFLQRLVASDGFHRFVLSTILLAGALSGLETHAGIVARYGTILDALDLVVLGVFVAEMACNIGAHGRRPWAYFHDPWNGFDFLIVLACLLPAHAEHAGVLRLVRMLRVLRLVTALPRLQLLVAALLRSLPSMAYVGLLLALLFYVYAVVGVSIFGRVDPARFGGVDVAALTLFQVLTLESWTDVMRGQLAAAVPPVWTALYFVSFILLGTMVTLNLLIGVIVNGMEEARQNMEDSERARHISTAGEPTGEDEVVALRRRVAEFDATLAALQRRFRHAGPSLTHGAPSQPGASPRRDGRNADADATLQHTFSETPTERR